MITSVALYKHKINNNNMKNTTIAVALFTLSLPVVSHAEYRVDAYFPDFVPSNLEQAIEYQEYRKCEKALQEFDEGYEPLAEAIEDDQKKTRSMESLRLERLLQEHVQKYSKEFAVCIRDAVKAGEKTMTEKEAERAQTRDLQLGQEANEDYDILEERFYEVKGENEALRAQITVLMGMIQQMLAMGFTTPQ